MISSATLTLDKVPPGEVVEVVAVRGRDPIKKRLIEMGLIRGARINVQRIAPLGDPMEIRIKGYNLSLRMKEAAGVTCRRIESA